MHDFQKLDYYELLGVSRHATLEEIKRGYRQQIARYHPDRNIGKSPEERAYANERSRSINEAYRVLSDSDARFAYNLGKPLPASARRPMSPERGGSADTPQPAAHRDHQAELYEQARAHLDAGRYVQAAANLRELQKLNPFYRNSAALLSQAEAALQESEQKPASTPISTTAAVWSEHVHRHRRWLLVAGGGVLVAVGIAVAVLNFSDSLAVGGGGPEATATPTAAALAELQPADAETAVLMESVVEEEPTIAPTAEPTAAPEPTAEPTAAPEPTAEPTAAPEPTAEPGTLLVADAFDTGGWATQQGAGWSVGYNNGIYRVTAGSGASDIWSYRTAAVATTNFSIGVDVQVLGGEAGLVARFVEETRDYVVLFIDPLNNSYSLERSRNGAKQVIETGQSDAIAAEPGAVNRVVLHLEGSEVRAFVNDELITNSVFPDAAQTNLYGVVVNGRSGAAEALFDNLEIRTLE